MPVKWVVVGFGILYLLFALSFLPSERLLPHAIGEAWEIVRGVLWGGMTVVSIGLLEIISPLASLLAQGGGFSRMHAEEGLLAAICFVIAIYSAMRLLRADLTPRKRGTFTFLLLFTLSLVAMVRFTIYSWGHFAS